MIKLFFLTLDNILRKNFRILLYMDDRNMNQPPPQSTLSQNSLEYPSVKVSHMSKCVTRGVPKCVAWVVMSAAICFACDGG